METMTILVGFKSGREIEFKTEMTPSEIYKTVDSSGIVDMEDILFDMSEVSHMYIVGSTHLDS